MEITKNEKGEYFFDGHRMLVSYMRGGFMRVRNLKQGDFEPPYLLESYPGPVGVVVAIVLGKEVRFGFSKANTVRGDRFNRDLGIKVAVERAMLYDITPENFHNHREDNGVGQALERIYHRAKNYFKDFYQQPPAH